MKFSIKKSDLLFLMQKVISVVPARSTMPILTNLFFKIDGETLIVRASDLDLTITAYTKMDFSGQNKEFVLNAKRFFNIVKELPETLIEFNTEDDSFISISTGTDLFKLPILNPQDFPDAPDFEELSKFNVNGGHIDKMSSTVRFAVAKDNTRPELKGIFCEIEDNKLTMVATDGHTLALFENECIAVKQDKKASFIVPPKAFDQLCKIISSENEEVGVRIGKTFLEFHTKSATLVTKLLTGEYPGVSGIIPATNNKNATVKRDELFAVLRRISVMSNSNTRQIRFSFKENNLTISTSDKDFHGEGKSSLPVKYDLEPIDIGFNADFVLEILKLLSNEEVIFSMNTPLSPALILPSDEDKDKKTLFLLMSLRLLDDK